MCDFLNQVFSRRAGVFYVSHSFTGFFKGVFSSCGAALLPWLMAIQAPAPR